MTPLILETEGFTLRFISTSGESTAVYESNIMLDAWASSLTVAIMEAESLAPLAIFQAFNQLLQEGFNGWIVAQDAPKTCTSFRIQQPSETEDALLVVTLGFKVKMPKGEQ